MVKNHKHDEVRSRNENFANKIKTKIYKEIPSDTNPYVAERVLIHGYDTKELMRKKSFVDVFFLLFRGELPSHSDRTLLEKLMIYLMDLGPRHPATRAAMNVGVGKTNTGHILPISVSLLSGDYLGGGGIESAMRFFRKNQKNSVRELISSVREHQNTDSQEVDEFPGFGRLYGSRDIYTCQSVKEFVESSDTNSALCWGEKLSDELAALNAGWMPYGVAAAVFSDLGFQPRAGMSLFQLLCSPGLVAHGLEFSNKPITAMPYVKDEDYTIERRQV